MIPRGLLRVVQGKHTSGRSDSGRHRKCGPARGRRPTQVFGVTVTCSLLMLFALPARGAAAGPTAAEKAHRSAPTQLSGLSRAEALSAAQRSFSEAFDPEPYAPMRLRGDDRVERFVSDSGALIDHGDGSFSLAETDLPARVRNKPLDLELAAGKRGWTPRNPLVAVSIAPVADAGVRFERGDFLPARAACRHEPAFDRPVVCSTATSSPTLTS